MTLASIAQRSKHAGLLGLAATLISATPSSAAPSYVERRVPGPLFGGGIALPAKVEPGLDPSLPTGAPLRLAAPTDAQASLCSPLYPLCVHSGTQQASHLRGGLALLEQAYRTLRGALQLPAPWTSSGAPHFDVYLSDNPSLTSVTTSPRAVAASSDRTVTSCEVPLRQLDLGAMVRCLSLGIASGLDAAETPALLNAYAAELAWITGTFDADDLAGIDDLQANPERTPIAGSASRDARGGALVLEALERAWQHPRPGWVATTLLALSRNQTASRGLSWNNEPDWFDVLRYSLGDSASATADWWGGFALDRALLGLQPASSRLRSLAVIGDAARVRFDWQIAWSSLPRRVALSRPLEPLGTAYLWLDLDQVHRGETLGFRAEWEAPVAFKWMLLSVDAQGREVGRLEVPYLETATSVERTWASFAAEGARAVVIAGVNLGAVDPAHPFDPDYDPWETHGCTVYLAKL
jgi:hypothetical protein